MLRFAFAVRPCGALAAILPVVKPGVQSCKFMKLMLCPKLNVMRKAVKQRIFHYTWCHRTLCMRSSVLLCEEIEMGPGFKNSFSVITLLNRNSFIQKLKKAGGESGSRNRSL